MKLLITGLVLLTTLTAARAQAGDGWIKVYLGDQDRNQIQASGTCTIVIQPTGGKRITLKAEPVSEEGGSGHLDHGGQVIAKGDHTVEFVLEMPVEEHEHAEGAHGHDESKGGHEEKSEHGHEHGEEEAAASFSHFQAPLGELGKDGTDLTFDAVVIIKTDDGTFNVKGFEYPFLDFATITTMMDKHLDEIQTLIDGSKLLKVHPVASKISKLAQSLPNAKGFPEDDRKEIEETCKAIISLFGEIDEVADAEKKQETIQILEKYRKKVSSLKEHVHDEEHGDYH